MCVTSLLVSLTYFGFRSLADMTEEEHLFLLSLRASQYMCALILIPRFASFILALASPAIECELNYSNINVPLSRYIIIENVIIVILFVLQLMFFWRNKIKVHGVTPFRFGISRSVAKTQAFTTFFACIFSIAGLWMLHKQEPLCMDTPLGMTSMLVFITSWFMTLMYLVEFAALRIRRSMKAREVKKRKLDLDFDIDDDECVLSETEKIISRQRKGKHNETIVMESNDAL